MRFACSCVPFHQEADLALGSYTLTPERSTVADPTTSFKDHTAVIVFRLQTSGSDLWSFLLQPFNAAVYVVISVSFVCVLLLLWLLETCSRSLAGHQGTGGTYQTLVDHAEVLLAGIITRCEYSCVSRSLSGIRLPIIQSWIFCAV